LPTGYVQSTQCGRMATFCRVQFSPGYRRPLDCVKSKFVHLEVIIEMDVHFIKHSTHAHQRFQCHLFGAASFGGYSVPPPHTAANLHHAKVECLLDVQE
jgi:hypothetical protein